MGKGQSKAVPLFRGAETAPHFILIEFCGGWGYLKFASAVADRIEAKYPGMFRIELRKDNGVTGRLEVNVYPNSKNATSGTSPIEVHTKKKGQGYPHSNWDTFEKRLTEATS